MLIYGYTLTELFDLLTDLCSMSFDFIWSVGQDFAQYLLTLQWVRDVSYLPMVGPAVSIYVLNEQLFLSNTFSYPIHFLMELPSEQKQLLMGIVNSLFLSLPLSFSHLLSLRRFAIDGAPAGISSSLGTVAGQSLYFVSTLLGLRFLVLPWIKLGPIVTTIGLWCGISICFDISHQRSLRTIHPSDRVTLFKMFCLNMVLALTEQGAIWNHFSALHWNLGATGLEIATKNHSLAADGAYIAGLVGGSLLFTLCFGVLFVKLRDLMIERFSLRFSWWIHRANSWFQVISITLALAPIFYYALDYAITSPVGYVAKDKRLKNTIFDLQDWEDNQPRSSKKRSRRRRTEFPKDCLPTDRGRYLRPRTLWKYTIEDLNFEAERFWAGRLQTDWKTWMGKRTPALTRRAIMWLVEHTRLGKGEKPLPAQWKITNLVGGGHDVYAWDIAKRTDIFLPDEWTYLLSPQEQADLLSEEEKTHLVALLLGKKKEAQIELKGRLGPEAASKAPLRKDALQKLTTQISNRRAEQVTNYDFNPLNENRVTDFRLALLAQGDASTPFGTRQALLNRTDSAFSNKWIARFLRYGSENRSPSSTIKLSNTDRERLEGIDGEIIDSAWLKEKGLQMRKRPPMYKDSLFKKAKDYGNEARVFSLPIPDLSPKPSDTAIDKQTAELLKKEESRIKLKTSFRKKFRKRMPDYRRERLKKTKQGYRQRTRRKKKMFYCNPVFKLLLRLDIDNFVRQQPPSHLLTSAEEKLLFERRLLLADYFHTCRYNTLRSKEDGAFATSKRQYITLPYVKNKPSVEKNAPYDQQIDPDGQEPQLDVEGCEPETGEPQPSDGRYQFAAGECEPDDEEDELFDDNTEPSESENGDIDDKATVRDQPKSYAEQPYNHQFKGTMSTARRLFAITEEAKRNPQGRRVTKYDQPLFKPLQTSDRS